MDMARPDYAQMISMIQTNCIGFLNTLNAAMPHLLKSDSPHIVNLSSDAGKKAFPGLAVYSGTKAFIEFVSNAMRVELKEEGVRITTVQPGNVQTHLHDLTTDKKAQENYGSEDEGQYLSPSDIVNAIYYALSSPSKVAINEILIEPQAEPI
jgi:NADP-dependent 3-hydroxy acid dehydrogenase YdfG